MKKTKTLYKFLREGLKSDSGHHEWKLNTWYKIDGKISICNNGFHASKTIYQAFGYVKGEILAEVEVRGDSVCEDDKECWSEMRIVKAWYWQKEDSVSLSIFAAELCIQNFEKLYPDDKRPREAIEAAKNYLKAVKSGDKKKIEAARSAARSAAYSAADSAYSAADSAAYSAYSAAFKKIVEKVDKWFKDRLSKLKKYE